MILILTAPDDEHANHVASKLRERGTSFVRFNPAQFPREAEISLAYSPQEGSNYRLRVAEAQVDLHSLRAVWYRRPDPPVAHEKSAMISSVSLYSRSAKPSCRICIMRWTVSGCPPRLPRCDRLSSRLHS